MKKSTISELVSMGFDVMPIEQQKRAEGGLLAADLIRDILAGNGDKYAGLTFNFQNGECVSLTNSMGQEFYCGPNININDFGGGGGGDNTYWIDRGTGLNTDLFPILLNSVNVTGSTSVIAGQLSSGFSTNGSSSGNVGSFWGIPVYVTGAAATGTAYTLPNIGIFIETSLWQNYSEEERIQLLAHEYGHQLQYELFVRITGSADLGQQAYNIVAAQSVFNALTGFGGSHMNISGEQLANLLSYVYHGQPPVAETSTNVPPGYWDPYYSFPGMRQP